jgi:hypothetical protein
VLGQSSSSPDRLALPWDLLSRGFNRTTSWSRSWGPLGGRTGRSGCGPGPASAGGPCPEPASAGGERRCSGFSAVARGGGPSWPAGGRGRSPVSTRRPSAGRRLPTGGDRCCSAIARCSGESRRGAAVTAPAATAAGTWSLAGAGAGTGAGDGDGTGAGIRAGTRAGRRSPSAAGAAAGTLAARRSPVAAGCFGRAGSRQGSSSPRPSWPRPALAGRSLPGGGSPRRARSFFFIRCSPMTTASTMTATTAGKPITSGVIAPSSKHDLVGGAARSRAVIDAGLPSSAGALSVTRADHSNAILPNPYGRCPEIREVFTTFALLSATLGLRYAKNLPV